MEKENKKYEQKCRQCKHLLPIPNFYYNNKEHKTCESCSKKRRKGGKICISCNETLANFNFEGKSAEYCKKCSLFNFKI